MQNLKQNQIPQWGHLHNYSNLQYVLYVNKFSNITINIVRNPDFKTLVDKVQKKCILQKKHFWGYFLQSFCFVPFCVILFYHLFNAFGKCVASSTFSAHLPLLALGSTDVSGCIALACEHTRTAGRTHAARTFCEVIQYLAYNTVVWVLIVQ